jgi:anti-sigma regulatory factor (Ser/Thr protein kinase)
MATLVYGVFDPRGRRLVVVNAGHLPALVAQPDAPVVFLETAGHPPLGARGGRPTEETAIELAPGGVVLLYTDGIVERRTESLELRLEKLRTLVDPDLPLDELVEHLFVELGDEAPTDDTAILALRLTPDITGPYTATIDAVPARLAELRATIRTWLAELGVSDELEFDILVATGEACANAIEHAYGPAGGAIEVSLARSADRLEATIRDEGSWREARGANRGRGLSMMRRLATTVDLIRRADGTEVRLVWDLRHRPAR